MKSKVMSFALALVLALSSAMPLLAADTADVVVNMEARKVVKGAEGKEKLESAGKAKPGDVIEYKAVYRNNGKKPAVNVLATIPVPLGTEYIPGSAKPAKVTASLNGKEYAAVPLKRKVTLPSGKEDMRDVPYEEYRSIRWEIKSLEPGKSSTVSMRVRISVAPPKAESPATK